MIRPVLALLGVLGAFAPGILRAQDAQEIMERAWDTYLERMSGIDDYTVTQTVMGMASTMYFVRDEIDGRVVFLPQMPQVQQVESPGGAASTNAAGQFDGQYFMRPDVAQRMTVEGRDTVDGNECWIIALDDFEGIELGGMGGVQTNFTPERMRMWMDTDQLIPRRIDMAGTMATPGGPQPLSSSALMMDYREIEGMLYPFRVEISSEGLGGAMSAGMGESTPEQQAEMQAAMTEMEAELENLPPEQRAMVERMMKAQTQGGMQEMMDEALSTMVVETTEVRVNAGPPSDP